MSIIQNILALLMRRRRSPEPPRTAIGASPTLPSGVHPAPAVRRPARSASAVPARRTWDNPTGTASSSARSSDDDWPSALPLVDELSKPAPAQSHHHHCPSPAPHESATNHESFRGSSCDRDDYNRNASGGTPDFGGSTDTGSLPD